MVEDRTKEEQSGPITYKVIILGETNVGKSSLLIRYVEDSFKEAVANTIGVNNTVKKLVIDEREVNLQIWDTAGQERFESIVTLFFREADGFVFVYDLSSKRSFGRMKQLISDLQDNVDPEFTVLVGNKSDCVGDVTIAEESETLGKLADSYGYHWYISSAKTGENVTKIFEDLANKLYYNKKKSAKKPGIDITKKKRRIRWCYK